MKITTAMFHDQAFGRWFKDRETWASWIVFLSALFALDMDDEQAALYRRHTGRSELPTMEAKEAWLVCGRRAGKSFILALVAVFIACFREYRQHLTPGERGTILIIATDRKQARVIMRYIKALLTEVPMLKRLVIAESTESIELSNRIVIEVGTASFRSTRGYTYVAVLCDEIAYWRSEEHAANPDFEILNAVKPGMATIPNAMLLCASSPFARSGALWEAYDNFFGVDGGPLVWKASTREMNPTVPIEFIESENRKDPTKAAAEYGAEFRADLEAFVPLEAVRACIAEGVPMRPPLKPGTGESIQYYAFVDSSGGMSDSFTMCIAHDESRRDKTRRSDGRQEDRDVAVIDLIVEKRPPFRPEHVVMDFVATLKTYGIRSVTGDAYAGEWVRDTFKRHHMQYHKSRLSKSDLFLEFLPALNNQTVELLDNADMANQFTGLQRRVLPSGREAVDHKSGGHDDIANAVAGAAVLVAQKRRRGRTTARFGGIY